MEREALKVARIASEVRWLRESMLRSADTEDKKRVAERCNELIDRRAAEIHFLENWSYDMRRAPCGTWTDGERSDAELRLATAKAAIRRAQRMKAELLAQQSNPRLRQHFDLHPHCNMSRVVRSQKRIEARDNCYSNKFIW
jgi:hypothetical protein